jgi:hypothetical protein
LIALLCFIEQLLRSRAVCFFFLRSLPETAVLVISGFNAVRAGMVPPFPLSLPGPPRASQYSADLYAADLRRSVGKSKY